MRVLLVGGGGREHALAWRLTRDDPSIEIIAAPGNPGIAAITGKTQCVPVNATICPVVSALPPAVPPPDVAVPSAA